MSFFQFIKSKVFWLNVLLAIVVTFILIMLLMWGLTFYTRSGRTVVVPDLKGYRTGQLSSVLDPLDLEYVVIDSIYKSDAVPGAIVEQIPRAGKEVKRGRQMFLTINAYTNELVVMPQLVDYSLRNAQVVLESCGLKVGNIVYRPSEYNGLVLGQMIDGRQVKAGEKIAKGTQVQLVVGSGAGGNNVVVPELIGLTYAEAEMSLEDASLKVGVAIYDNTVTTKSDSTMAVVYRQNPNGLNGQTATAGSGVTIWLTKNQDIVIDAMEDIENSNQ